MASDLAEAIVQLAVDAHRSDEAMRSKKLFVKREGLVVWASFKGIDIGHVMITVSLSGEDKDAFDLRIAVRTRRPRLL